MREYNNILIIRLSALGDVAMTIPVVYSVAETYPAKTFTVLTRPFFARLFINKPKNVEVLAWDFVRGIKSLTNMPALINNLRKRDFDSIIDMHNVLRSWLIDAYFITSGKRVVMVDKMRNNRASLISSHNTKAHPKMTDRYLKLFDRLGMPSTLTFKSLYQNTSPSLPFAIPSKSVGIAPFARYANKTYPIEKMERVVALLSSKSINVFLFGSKGNEADVMHQWEDRYKHCRSIAGKYNIENELAVMSSLKLMVAMDSANQHLAAISGTRVITIWGATTPACGFMGYGQLKQDSICLGKKCQPCSIAGSNICKEGTMSCLNSLQPEVIVSIIENIVNK